MPFVTHSFAAEVAEEAREMRSARTSALVAAVLILLAGPLLAETSERCCYELAAEIRMAEAGDGLLAQELFHGVAAKDGFAYVVTQADVLYVFDLRELPETGDPIRVDQPVAQILLSHGTRSGLLRDGDRLYVYGWGGGLILDIEDAANPIQIGAFRDSDERIFHLAKDGHVFIAACHERVVIYSEEMLPDYPMLAYNLEMEPWVQASGVAVVGDRLVVSGSRRRSSGATESWLGIWDVSDFTRPQFLSAGRAGPHSSQVVASGTDLLRVAGGGAELWRVDGVEPQLLDDAVICGRAIALDGDIIVFDGGALMVEEDRIEPLCAFDSTEDMCYDGFPSLGTSTNGHVLLARPRSILVLRRVDAASVEPTP